MVSTEEGTTKLSYVNEIGVFGTLTDSIANPTEKDLSDLKLDPKFAKPARDYIAEYRERNGE